MSNTYSLGAYKIAILTRTHRTILVEGKDDKELFSRLKSKMPSAFYVNIDTSDIIVDDSLSGLGAKEKIDVLASQVTFPSGLAQKLRCVVDREWEQLVDPTNHEPLAWCQPVQDGVRLTTAGHSIENYGFFPEFVSTYLTHFGNGVASAELLREVDRCVPELVRASAAFSEVARKRRIIGRCNDIIDLHDIEWKDGRIIFKSEVELKLVGRGANAAGFLEQYAVEYDAKWAQGPFAQEAHFHAHGHLGEAILWLGIARIVVDRGFGEAIGREIATGRRDEKRRVWHGWLTSLPTSAISPIHQAFT